MTPTRQGSFRLFRFAGIDVYLHWAWFLAAIYILSTRRESYAGSFGLFWSVLEYLALFVIVLMHEFGHSLACRGVGGEANQIILWPLGGVAYVQPPPRPGATLWSIAAGPLVNVVLMPIFVGLSLFSEAANLGATQPNLHRFLQDLMWINIVILVFNCLPVFPLDGGQIFRCLLWFVVGRARSLMVATIIGFIAAAALLAFVLFSGPGDKFWLTLIAVFMLLNCWGGWVHARMLAKTEEAPRHDGFACPYCGQPPPRSTFWRCGRCRKGFDTFLTNAVCPHCGAAYGTTMCPNCGKMSAIEEWAVPPVVPTLPNSVPPPVPPSHNYQQ